MTMPTCARLERAGNLELSNIPLARRLVMSNTLELRVLDDDELMDVVGGCNSPCETRYNHCESRGDDFRLDIDINVDVVICL
jgi:hypothetical protein